jgi:hypothetical protein
MHGESLKEGSAQGIDQELGGKFKIARGIWGFLSVFTLVYFCFLEK